MAMGEGLLLARSDGVMLVLDRQLVPRNLGSREVPLPGVRFGGYYSGGCGSFAAPVAARLDGRADSILMVNSQRELLRLEASMASRLRAPEVAWRWPGAFHPNIVDVDGDGAKDVVAITDSRIPAQNTTVNARRADGVSSIFSRTVPDTSSESLFGDVVPLAGPGGQRFAVVATNASDGTSRAYVLSGRGDRLFATPPTRYAGSGLGYLSAYDINGDGRDDFMFEQASVLYLVDGANGAALGRGLSTYPQMNVIVAGRAGATQWITGGAYARVEGIRLDRDAMMNYVPVAQWSWSNSTYPAGSPYNCFGAVVQCPDGLRYAQALSTSPRLVVTNATTGAVIFDVALAQGRAFANESELRTAVAAPGLLTNVNATPSITGSSIRTPAFVVGSSEGFLYAIDACAPSPNVRWAMNFRAPVGEAIFADTDADGSDEIIVSSADGFLHGIDTELFPAPAFVYEIDPPRVVSMDVDERMGSSLEAMWAAVPGAVAYEWALFTATGSPVSRGARPEDGPFIRTTDTTAFWNEGLVDQTRYFFAVRAIGPGGVASVETLSNGVRFIRANAVTDAGSEAGTEDGGSQDATVIDTGAVTDSGVMDRDASATDASATMDSSHDASMGSMSGGCGCRVTAPTHGPSRKTAQYSVLAMVALGAIASIASRRARRCS
jgi:MYXO-CTERM domain-containing protein